MILIIAGARPNFMKIAPIVWEFERRSFADYKIVHTGQHYDYEMSQAFFEDLSLGEPDFFLNVGSGTHTYQTASVMIALEEICTELNPHLIIVVGDVNSTLASSLVASKQRIPLAHVEAGLRSFDMAMPEEVNRILTDHVSDFLLVSEQSGIDNLKREGIPDDRVHFVGNIMIDSLNRILPKAHKEKPTAGEYIAATIHRPSNVDDAASLSKIIDLLSDAAKHHPVVMPAHPRTKKNLILFGLEKHFLQEPRFPESPEPGNIYLVPPIGYVGFVGMMAGAHYVITDSGGIQEETTFLGIPCVTLRENTERPATVEIGTNTVVGTDKAAFGETIKNIREGTYKTGGRPPLWDGKTSERVCDILLSAYSP